MAYYNEYINIIIRNPKLFDKLAEYIYDVSHIDYNCLKLIGKGSI